MKVRIWGERGKNGHPVLFSNHMSYDDGDIIIDCNKKYISQSFHNGVMIRLYEQENPLTDFEILFWKTLIENDYLSISVQKV